MYTIIDAAELDALDDFLLTMFYLSYLEDCEEEDMKACDDCIVKTKNRKVPTYHHQDPSSAIMTLDEPIRYPTRNDLIRLFREDPSRLEYGYLHFHGSKESLDCYLRVMERAQHHKVGHRVRTRNKIPHYNIQQPRRHCT